MLPFTVKQFFHVFERYNRTIWPTQLVAYGLAASVLWAIATNRPWNWRAAAIVLAAFWLWNGLVYHHAFFAPINPAAYGFAALFVTQGLIFLVSGLRDRNVSVVVGRDRRTVLALVTIAYTLVIYSALGFLTGHGWPRAPVFGVAPCPTTIFTFGILMLAGRAISVALARCDSSGVGTDRIDHGCAARRARGSWIARISRSGESNPLPSEVAGLREGRRDQ